MLASLISLLLLSHDFLSLTVKRGFESAPQDGFFGVISVTGLDLQLADLVQFKLDPTLNL